MIDPARLLAVLIPGEWVETHNPRIVTDDDLGPMLAFEHKGLQVGDVETQVPIANVSAYRFRP